MKKLIFTFLFIIASVASYGQGCIYSQDFENPITGISSVGNPGFVPNTVLYHDGVQSYFGTYAATDSAVATTVDIDLSGMTFVKLKFWHICKIEFFDMGIIEVSNDGGVNWTKLTSAQYENNNIPPSNFFSQGNKFTEAAYTGWHPADTVTPVDSSWWREETFNISSIVGSGSVTNAKIRFVEKDLNGNGMAGRVGWYIDQICVLAAPCEIDPPTFTLLTPLTGTVYNLGPYNLNAYVNDASGLAGVYIFWTINNIPQPVIPMFNPGGDSLYTGQIPAVADSDTVCYYFWAFDASCITAETYYPQPPTSTICFIASSGISFPYCDNFDVNLDLWTDSTVANSGWELGTPNFGLTNTAHSSPNSWDISLNSGYSANSEAYLTSPVFNFNNTQNARMSFWYNCATDNFDEAGVRLEISVNSSPWSVLTTADDPSAVNWYNSTNLSSSGTAGWGGNSGGWKEAKFNLNSFSNTGNLQMRFVFTSDFNTGDGFSIDDFCIIQPPPEDMGVDQVIEPFPSSGAGTTSNAIVRVRNYGTATQTTFDVVYSINNIPQDTVAYTGSPLAPNDTAIVTLSTFPVPSLFYDFCAWTVLPADADHTNDTLCEQHQGIPVLALTYCNDFDAGGGAGWTSIPSPIGNTLWELGTPAFGVTNTAYSNPNSWDINLTTAYENEADAKLVSPFFDFTGMANVGLSFWQNRRVETNWDGVRIEYSENGLPWQVLGSIGAIQSVNWYTNTINSSGGLPAWDNTTGGTWIKSSLNVSQFNNVGLVQLQFVFTSDLSVIWDGFSIDNFCLTLPPPTDVGVDSILSPTANSGAGTSSDVIVRVRNFGSQPVTNFDVYYVYAGTTYGPVNYSGTAIAPNATLIDTIAPQIVIPPGAFCIQAYTSLAADMDHTNDSLSGCMFGVPVDTLSYCNDFEGAFVDWSATPTPGGGSTWELGTPNFGVTTGAHSGVNAWDVDLNSGYTSNANTTLNSPFFDFSTASNVQLSFWRNNRVENAFDGARIDYSIGGGTWNVLGTFPDPNGVNWYNDVSLNSSLLPAWTNASSGWIKSEYNMSQFNNQVPLLQLRFAFTSDATVIQDGFSIDDFCLKNPPPFDGGVISIDAPVQQGLAIGSAYNIDVTIRNFGQNAISNFPVVYKFNGSTFTGTFTGTIPPSFIATQTFTCPVPFIAISGSFDICAWTEVPSDGDAANDTTCRTYVGVPTITPTYTDSFDGPNIGWTTESANPQTIWELGAPNFGTTNSSYSPPNCWDINLNNTYFANANASLVSPYFDFTTVVKGELSFFMNYKVDNFNGEGMHVEYSINGGGSWNVLGAVGAANSINWYNSNNIFSSATEGWNGSAPWQLTKFVDNNGDMDGQPNVRFRFVFTSDAFPTGDGVSIDDIKVYRPIPNTAATLDVKATYGILQPGMQSLSGLIKNTGYIPLTSVLVTLQVDAVIICTDTINPTPTPGGVPFDSTFWHTFSCQWNASPGAHDICIWTSYPNQTVDEFPSDDTTCVVLTVFDTISQFPYCTDFESGPKWVTLNSTTFAQTSSWELGTPIKTNFIGAFNGSNAWVTKLAAEYPNLDESSLFTPVFNVGIGKCYELSFMHNFDMDLFNDGGSIEYSIDSAKTWKVLGDIGDAVSWYNSVYIAAYGFPVHAGFTGFNGGWISSSHNFKAPATGTVIFRFRFSSDQTNNADGWEIDQFCFKEITGSCVTAVEEPAAAGLYLYQNAPNPASGSTTIAFNLPASGKAELTVTNLVGQIVAKPVNDNLGEGRHTVNLNSKDFTPGIYYYTLKFNNSKIVRKMVITQ
ncbi:MAG: T9SS type A sorting domain-containing protein [Bacteroidia bacterium]